MKQFFTEFEQVASLGHDHRIQPGKTLDDGTSVSRDEFFG